MNSFTAEARSAQRDAEEKREGHLPFPASLRVLCAVAVNGEFV